MNRLNCKENMTQEHKTKFGFQDVLPEEKTRLVTQVFSSVASRYDIMNDLMSGGVHRWWKNQLVFMTRPRPGQKILDVAGGTGDIATRILQASGNQAHVTVCDRNIDMISEGRDRQIDRGSLSGIEWVCGDGAQLPFEDNTFDTYTISFGLRNITDIAQAIKEAYRVLKPGGQYFCLEFSKVTNPLLKKAYKAYSFGVIPAIGSIVAKDKDSYQYLVESIENFPDQETLKQMIADQGFQQVSYTNLTQGVVAIHSGIK